MAFNANKGVSMNLIKELISILFGKNKEIYKNESQDEIGPSLRARSTDSDQEESMTHYLIDHDGKR